METFSSSLRNRYARFRRKTNCCSKSFNNLCDTILIWANRDRYLKNIRLYCDNILYNNTTNKNNKDIMNENIKIPREYTYTGFNSRTKISKNMFKKCRIEAVI